VKATSESADSRRVIGKAKSPPGLSSTARYFPVISSGDSEPEHDITTKLKAAIKNVTDLGNILSFLFKLVKVRDFRSPIKYKRVYG
jgi:hypothetical protein